MSIVISWNDHGTFHTLDPINDDNVKGIVVNIGEDVNSGIIKMMTSARANSAIILRMKGKETITYFADLKKPLLGRATFSLRESNS